MKKLNAALTFCFGILLLLSSSCVSHEQISTTKDATQPQHLSSFILKNDQTPTTALSEVLKHFQLTDESLDAIVEKTQKAWLRPSGVERFNMQDLHEDKKTVLMPLFKKLGLIEKIAPLNKTYKYALVHGGNIISTRARISYLASLWNAGIKFEQLVFLTGQRDLDEKLESVAMLQSQAVEAIRKQAAWILPIKSDWIYESTMPFKTEIDMTKIIYNQTLLPETLKNIPVVFIDAPKRKGLDGKLQRPNTADTINSWLQTSPAEGNCLFVSNQPFIGYQDAAVRKLMPSNFEVETVGFAVQSGHDSVSLVLDSLARWLYQELQNTKKL